MSLIFWQGLFVDITILYNSGDEAIRKLWFVFSDASE